MTGPSDISPVGPSGGSLARRPARRLVLPVVSMAAALAAMVVLTMQASDEMLAYGVGIVPQVVPWLAAILSIALAVLGSSERKARSAGASVAMGALVALAAWSIVMLPFDLLRIVGLVRRSDPARRLVVDVGREPRVGVLDGIRRRPAQPEVRGSTQGGEGDELDHWVTWKVRLR